MRCLAAAMLAMLAACAPLDATAPRGVDLSGNWRLDAAQSDPPPDLAAIRGREDRAVVRGRRLDTGVSAAFLVQDFPVLAAERLRIDQNADSMGIRYGESDYRDISWGARERDFWRIRAGWEDGALTIRSRRDDVRGIETMALQDQGRQLRITVRIDTAGEDVRAVRVFRRD